jgi:putative tryptophan/tyrosine transport system substrate-binding protein
MERREFIALLVAAMACPEAAAAQKASMPVIGFLSSASHSASQLLLNDFRKGLAEAGYEGQSVTIEYRWADGRYDVLPALAEDLVSRRVSVIATAGGSTSAIAASKATATIPIVSIMGSDPVKLGLTASLSRPDKNVTGVAQLLAEAEGKRLEILHELMPNAKTVGYLANPNNARFREQRALVEQAASSFDAKVHLLSVTTKAEISAALTSAARDGIAAVLVAADPFLFINIDHIVALTATHSLPAVYFVREYVRAGGLISYGTRLGDALRQTGIYTGRILSGAKPADLPIVQQSEKIELIVNLKTARTLGITVPNSRLLRADEVVE